MIRHALTDAVASNKLSGWTPGVNLNEEGKAQAFELAERLAHLPVKAIYSSPLERAVETAEVIARVFNLEVQTIEQLGELRFGEWTGKNFDELEREAKWRKFNLFRSCTRTPNGELMLEAQVRIIVGLEELRERHSDETIAVVSHSDLIKAAIAHYAGIHLDLFQRIEINPASVSVVSLYEENVRILSINNTGKIKVI